MQVEFSNSMNSGRIELYRKEYIVTDAALKVFLWLEQKIDVSLEKRIEQLKEKKRELKGFIQKCEGDDKLNSIWKFVFWYHAYSLKQEENRFLSEIQKQIISSDQKILVDEGIQRFRVYQNLCSMKLFRKHIQLVGNYTLSIDRKNQEFVQFKSVTRKIEGRYLEGMGFCPSFLKEDVRFQNIEIDELHDAQFTISNAWKQELYDEEGNVILRICRSGGVGDFTNLETNIAKLFAKKFFQRELLMRLNRLINQFMPLLYTHAISFAENLEEGPNFFLDTGDFYLTLISLLKPEGNLLEYHLLKDTEFVINLFNDTHYMLVFDGKKEIDSDDVIHIPVPLKKNGSHVALNLCLNFYNFSVNDASESTSLQKDINQQALNKTIKRHRKFNRWSQKHNEFSRENFLKLKMKALKETSFMIAADFLEFEEQTGACICVSSRHGIDRVGALMMHVEPRYLKREAEKRGLQCEASRQVALHGPNHSIAEINTLYKVIRVAPQYIPGLNLYEKVHNTVLACANWRQLLNVAYSLLPIKLPFIG